MRYFEIIQESLTTQVRPIKAWYNPSTGEAIVFSIRQTHGDIALKNKEKMSIPADDSSGFSAIIRAMEAGWVRVRNFNEAKMYDPDVRSGTDAAVQAATPMQARKTLIWMRDSDYLPDSVTIEIGAGRSRATNLRDEQIDHYIAHGTVPAHDFI
jgi:hypothetical protein